MKFTMPSAFSFLLALLLAAAPAFVQGHAYVQNVTIGDKVYTGWLPFTMPYTDPIGKSIVRTVSGDNPILDIKSRDLACHQGGEKPAALIADVNAGQTVKLTLNRWFLDHAGPVTVHMANCNPDCMNFDPSEGKVWFKIDQVAINNGVWGTHQLMKQGNSWNVKIPDSIKAGEYLIRLELLALHNTGQPQFYPSCTQVNIKSSGSNVPSDSDLAAIPGIYDNAGEAIYGDIWSVTPTTWPVVGPSVVPWAKDGYNGGETSSTVSPSPTQSLSTLHGTSGGSETSTTPPHTDSPTPSSTATPNRCGKNNVRRSPPPMVGADEPRRMIKRAVAVRTPSPADVAEDDGMSARDSERADAPAGKVYRRHAHAHMLRDKRGAWGMRVPPVALLEPLV